MTLESLARTIAKARHGTDAMWANYMGAAEAVMDGFEKFMGRPMNAEERSKLRALLAQPGGAQEGLFGIDTTRFPFNEAEE